MMRSEDPLFTPAALSFLIDSTFSKMLASQRSLIESQEKIEISQRLLSDRLENIGSSQ